MECHLVHWNQKYLTLEEYLKHRDGFCVLAYLFLVYFISYLLLVINNFVS